MEGVIRHWPTERAKAWLVSFVERSRRDDNVVALVAIGSAVRPTAAAEDLDILALCRDKSALKDKAPIEVDVRKMKEIGDQNALCDLNVSYLTHLAWARLAKACVFPRSRPEIPGQLEAIGEHDLAAKLTRALAERQA